MINLQNLVKSIVDILRDSDACITESNPIYPHKCIIALDKGDAPYYYYYYPLNRVSQLVG